MNTFSAIVLISTENSKGCLLKFEAQCVLISWSVYICHLCFQRLLMGKLRLGCVICICSKGISFV